MSIPEYIIGMGMLCLLAFVSFAKFSIHLKIQCLLCWLIGHKWRHEESDIVIEYPNCRRCGIENPEYVEQPEEQEDEQY
jgi:hypothetical protein